MSDTANNPNQTTEIWYYRGRRESTGGKEISCWLSEDGQEYNFKAGKGTTASAIGHAYEVTTKEEGGAKYKIGAPRYLSNKPPHALAGEWVAQERAWRIEKDRTAMENKAKDDNRYAESLEYLNKIYTGTSHRFRAAMLADMISKITRR